MDARVVRAVDAGPEQHGMLGEPHSYGGVANSLLEESKVGVLLNRLGVVVSDGALSDDHALTDHTDGLVEVGIDLSPDGVDVLDEKSLQLLLGVGGGLGVLESVLSDLVKLDLAKETLRELVVDC